MKKWITLLQLIVIIFTATNFNNTHAQNVDFKDFNKKEKLKINKMLALNFFANFELSNRNENLSIIYDYIPIFNTTNVKEVNITTNLAGVKDDIFFHYNDKTNKLENIEYYLDDLLFKYQFIYDKENLLTIKVKNKKKYQFVYKKKLLTKVIFYKDEIAEYIFYIEYHGKNDAILKTKAVDLGKINERNKYEEMFITWNDNFELVDFQFAQYKSEIIRYNDFGDVSSFLVDDFLSDKNLIEWNYTYDSFNNWTERSFDNINISRKITYLK